jgi:hypothetical protein
MTTTFQNKTDFSHVEYFNEFKDKMVKYKLSDLKNIAKFNRLKGMKTKKDHLQKIHAHFEKIHNAIKIQKTCRGFFVRLFLKTKGDVKQREKCVNDTDFYTLDPLSEINEKELFFIKDDKDFVYGFSVKSLANMFRKNGNIINPYNRNAFNGEQIHNIFTHYFLLRIIFKECFTEDELSIKFPFPSKNTGILPQRRRFPRSLMNPGLTITIPQPTRNIPILHIPAYNTGDATEPARPRPRYETADVDVQIEYLRIRRQLIQLRQTPLSSRIQELFMYIDQLGNYTDSTWFSGLSKRQYYMFYSQLRELWVFRGEIPTQIKQLICPLGDPFIDSTIIFRKPYDQITDNEICECCLNVIENMILTSFDVEYKRIGCLHVLTALTVVCPQARTQYGYLFDSIV